MMRLSISLIICLLSAIALKAQKTACEDEQIQLTSLSPESGPLGTKITIEGCNLADANGKVSIWITHKATRISGLLHAATELKSNQHSYDVDLVSLMCNHRYTNEKTREGDIGPCLSYLHIIPGEYEIHASVGKAKSNTISFTVEAFQ